MKKGYQQILDEILVETEPLQGKGKAANYIPQLAKVNPDQFGIHLQMLDGNAYAIGDAQVPFSIQSISKVLSLAMLIGQPEGEKVWKRVGVEPSGTAFNSLLQLEYENGIPRNPFINAGALVVADQLISTIDHPKQQLLQFVRKLANRQQVYYNEAVAASEKEHGFRNAALANLLKAFGNLHNSVEEVLDVYFHMCAIEMSCETLAQTFLVFANQGKIPYSGEAVLSLSQTKRMNALMQTCGFYDEAGEFTFTVGLPGKSGVGGGIVAVFPGKFSIGVWSPRLNEKGNSIMGMKALELFTTKSELSVF
jgi:glutaminase